MVTQLPIKMHERCLVAEAEGLASSCSWPTNSGCSTRQCSVQVSTAAVVSWPAISSVIRSSRSCWLDTCTEAVI